MEADPPWGWLKQNSLKAAFLWMHPAPVQVLMGSAHME